MPDPGTATVVVTRTSGTTTYYAVTHYHLSDNGTATFWGRKGDENAPLGEYAIGHGSYEEIEHIP